MLETLLTNPIIDSALVLAVTEVVKRTVGLNKRYIPIVSIVVGMLLFGVLDGFNAVSAFAGLISGLTASGLYSGVKATAGK